MTELRVFLHSLNDHIDTLTELLNAGGDRAAASLCQLTGCKVDVQVPAVGVVKNTDFAHELEARGPGGFSVTVPFAGGISGRATLVLDHESAIRLAGILVPNAPTVLDSSARDALTETASIVLNAMIGSLGNLLSFHVTFGVPSVKQITAGQEQAIWAAANGADTTVWAETKFVLSGTSVSARVFLHGDSNSITTLVRALRTRSQVAKD